jgi:hypothetical protein
VKGWERKNVPVFCFTGKGRWFPLCHFVTERAAELHTLPGAFTQVYSR